MRRNRTSKSSGLKPKELELLTATWRKYTALPYIELTPMRETSSVWDSKLGGRPYLPPGFIYPHNNDPESDGRPLKMLAQLNFAQIPRLEGFPAAGILQFYIANEACDDLFGLNLENQTDQTGWRMVYHKDIVTDASKLQLPPELESGDDVRPFPFSGEYRLAMQLEEWVVTPMDYRWEAFMDNLVRPLPFYQSRKKKSQEQGLENLMREVSGEYAYGFKIGGYPAFTQEDPRCLDRYKDYSVLLLQLDSWWDEKDPGIMFGDGGVANWFIKPEALARADFSDVLYNWDCF